MVTEGSLGFDSVSFDGKYWYEIDTLEDLEKAEKLFSAKKPVVVVSRKAKIIDAVKDKTLTNIKPFHSRLYRKKKDLSLNTST